jgi:PAS domain-containing protein
VGQSLGDLQGWRWTAFIHPEDVEGIVEKWRACLASGEHFLHEARVLRADGEYRWMLHHKVAALTSEAKSLSGMDRVSISRIASRRSKSANKKRNYGRFWISHRSTFLYLPLWENHSTPNRAALEYFGIDIDQWRAEKTRIQFVHPDDRECSSVSEIRVIRGEAA